jgi:hypothetical protein
MLRSRTAAGPTGAYLVTVIAAMLTALITSTVWLSVASAAIALLCTVAATIPVIRSQR